MARFPFRFLLICSLDPAIGYSQRAAHPVEEAKAIGQDRRARSEWVDRVTIAPTPPPSQTGATSMNSLNLILVLLLSGASQARADDPPIRPNLSGYDPRCRVKVDVNDDRLLVTWPSVDREVGWMTLRLRPGKPLIEGWGATSPEAHERVATIADADPFARVTVGTRQAGKNRPPAMSPFNVFFDSPHTRPSQDHDSTFALKSMALDGKGDRLAIDVGDVEFGPFRGKWRLTFFAGSRLVMLEAVVRTDRDLVAFVYDMGLASKQLGKGRIAWTSAGGASLSVPMSAGSVPGGIAVRHRALAYESGDAAVVFTPPPHQYFFPRDYTTNVKTAWNGDLGDGRRVLGIRQDRTGGGNFVPWFNAPPGTEQHLKLFLHISRARAEEGLKQMLAYTRGDRFVPIPDHVTFTSHYHMAITAAAMARVEKGDTPDPSPAYRDMFKAMNVNAVHLGEFHGDGHQYDPGPLRLSELKAMFDECRRLSDESILFLPGEEVARFLGKTGPGRESGHWMTLFPNPVYWVLDRKPNQPFVSEVPGYGKVYRVGSAKDVQKVLDAEHGLAWTAHPRIKSSSWAPDAFFDEPYFREDTFLGAAWKAMPADLSNPALGRRGLDLLDDMANLGARKYLPGEVDVFTLDPTHELYGHMNINYLRLDKLPTFDEGWAPILATLRHGAFFTTTGEILIEEFTVNGVESGGTVTLNAESKAKVRVALKGTYPLEVLEIVSADGEKVFRSSVDLRGTGSFDGATVAEDHPELLGRKWVRVMAYDVAGNTAYTQPIWIGD